MPLTDTINRFALGVTRLFASAAKGLDEPSKRFVRARPYERILTGFLTPVDQEDEPIEEREGGVPELPQDDSYERTSIGFEWAVPNAALRLDTLLDISFGFNVYMRVVPTYQEAVANTRFDSQGQARLVEVWERVVLAAMQEPMHGRVSLAELASKRSIRQAFEPQVAGSWRTRIAEIAAFQVGQREPVLVQADLDNEGAYLAAVQRHLRAGPEMACRWHPTLDIRVLPSPTEAGCQRVLVRLVNMTRPVSNQGAAFGDPRLYAVSLVAKLDRDAQRDISFRILPASYRYDRRLGAVGINCQPRLSGSGHSLTIEAETVPVKAGPRVVPRDVDGGTPRFDALAQEVTARPILAAILAAMRQYDATDWGPKVDSLADPDELAEATRDRNSFREEIEAFAEGIRLLEDPRVEHVARAFYSMNETMRRLGQGRRRPFEQWHLFQIVFIVAMLPRLARTEGSDQGSTEAAERPLDLLWFPAGGGKTEAFLGVILWHAFYDRLRGKSLGVTAFVRYPLRLLTYQQLQRISRALGKAEEVRREEGLEGQPFSLGYFVGESTTPNSISDDVHRRLEATGVPTDWQRVFACPFCGRSSVAIRYDAGLRVVEHYCREHSCSTRGASLPIYIVDDDLYRYLPTVIVSTVDKLAQLGQNRRFAQLLGRIELYCPAHGAAFGGSNRRLCEASTARAQGRPGTTCGRTTVVVGPFLDLGPSLHVQDELHLMRESLATFDSHYETAAMHMQESIDDEQRRWSLIGSTATIEGYQEQALHLYQVSARRFPAPGPEAYESFYYSAEAESLGRLFVGVIGVGRTHTPSVARAISILHTIVEGIRKHSQGELPRIREAFNLPDITPVELEELAFQYEVILTYVLTRKGGDQVGEAIDARVRGEVEQLGGANLRVESFHSNVDMGRMISTMEEIEGASQDTPLGDRVRGVVATNIISHGVDIDRFNIMVFAGFPRQVAEYIQASARVGRQLPGISVLVVTPQAERDRSVFDRFDKFHEYVDRLVEPVPVNRWSSAAAELTVPGLVAGYLMGVAPKRLNREVYLVGHVRSAFGMRGSESLNQAEVCGWVRAALCPVEGAAPPEFVEAIQRMAERNHSAVAGASADYDNESINIHLSAMRSLRDVDDPAWIRLSPGDREQLSRLGL